MATEEEMATIRAMRMDDVAREMMSDGVTLTWEQIEELGEMRVDWLRSRLGLATVTTEDGIDASPTVRYGADGRPIERREAK